LRTKISETRNKKTLILKQPTSTILPTIKKEKNTIKKLPFINVKSTTNRDNKKFLILSQNLTNENKKKSKTQKKSEF
jgi:hypothetical protein